MKKILVFILAVMMCCSMGMTAFAEGIIDDSDTPLPAGSDEVIVEDTEKEATAEPTESAETEIPVSAEPTEEIVMEDAEEAPSPVISENAEIEAESSKKDIEAATLADGIAVQTLSGNNTTQITWPQYMNSQWRIKETVDEIYANMDTEIQFDVLPYGMGHGLGYGHVKNYYSYEFSMSDYLKYLEEFHLGTFSYAEWNSELQGWYHVDDFAAYNYKVQIGYRINGVPQYYDVTPETIYNAYGTVGWSDEHGQYIECKKTWTRSDFANAVGANIDSFELISFTLTWQWPNEYYGSQLRMYSHNSDLQPIEQDSRYTIWEDNAYFKYDFAGATGSELNKNLREEMNYFFQYYYNGGYTSMAVIFPYVYLKEYPDPNLDISMTSSTNQQNLITLQLRNVSIPKTNFGEGIPVIKYSFSGLDDVLPYTMRIGEMTQLLIGDSLNTEESLYGGTASIKIGMKDGSVIDPFTTGLNNVKTTDVISIYEHWELMRGKGGLSYIEITWNRVVKGEFGSSNGTMFRYPALEVSGGVYGYTQLLSADTTWNNYGYIQLDATGSYIGTTASSSKTLTATVDVTVNATDGGNNANLSKSATATIRRSSESPSRHSYIVEGLIQVTAPVVYRYSPFNTSLINRELLYDTRAEYTITFVGDVQYFNIGTYSNEYTSYKVYFGNGENEIDVTDSVTLGADISDVVPAGYTYMRLVFEGVTYGFSCTSGASICVDQDSAGLHSADRIVLSSKGTLYRNGNELNTSSGTNTVFVQNEQLKLISLTALATVAQEDTLTVNLDQFYIESGLFNAGMGTLTYTFSDGMQPKTFVLGQTARHYTAAEGGYGYYKIVFGMENGDEVTPTTLAIVKSGATVITISDYESDLNGKGDIKYIRAEWLGQLAAPFGAYNGATINNGYIYPIGLTTPWTLPGYIVFDVSNVAGNTNAEVNVTLNIVADTSTFTASAKSTTLVEAASTHIAVSVPVKMIWGAFPGDEVISPTYTIKNKNSDGNVGVELIDVTYEAGQDEIFPGFSFGSTSLGEISPGIPLSTALSSNINTLLQSVELTPDGSELLEMRFNGLYGKTGSVLTDITYGESKTLTHNMIFQFNLLD